MGHKQYRARVTKTGFEDFSSSILFIWEGSGSYPEGTCDAAFQAFVDMIDTSTEFEFATYPSSDAPPQKWNTTKSEVTPT